MASVGNGRGGCDGHVARDLLRGDGAATNCSESADVGRLLRGSLFSSEMAVSGAFFRCTSRGVAIPSGRWAITSNASPPRSDPFGLDGRALRFVAFRGRRVARSGGCVFTEGKRGFHDACIASDPPLAMHRCFKARCPRFASTDRLQKLI